MQIDSTTDTLIGSSFSNNPQNNLSIVEKVFASGLESEMTLVDSNVLVGESGRPGKRPKITDDKVRKKNLKWEFELNWKLE